jgi:L-alanine-DL-glutamate epimerase-like enolase superfamily enzyme
MRVEPFALSLAEPLGTARGRITERAGFVVALDLDGVVGVGEAAPLPDWTESLNACEAALTAVAAGIDEGREPGAYLSREDGDESDGDALHGAPAARHAVATAVLDAGARRAGEPLHERLTREYGTRSAPAAVETVPVNATVGDGAPAETAEAAAEAVEAGFGTVKLKIGARDAESDSERVAAVRDRCPSADLRADANGAWDGDTARRALAAFADDRVAYVEQPLPVDTTTDGEGQRHDLTAYASLRGGAVGIALDESLAAGGEGLAPVHAALDAGAADAVVLKPMALGGPDRAVAAATAARQAGVTPVVTTTIDGALARATAVHVAAAIPDVPACGLATGSRLAEDLLSTDPAPVASGAVRVPDGPGITGGTRWHDPTS